MLRVEFTRKRRGGNGEGNGDAATKKHRVSLEEGSTSKGQLKGVSGKQLTEQLKDAPEDQVEETSEEELEEQLEDPKVQAEEVSGEQPKKELEDAPKDQIEDSSGDQLEEQLEVTPEEEIKFEKEIKRRKIDLSTLDLDKSYEDEIEWPPKKIEKPPRKKWKWDGDEPLNDWSKLPKGWTNEDSDLDQLQVKFQCT